MTYSITGNSYLYSGLQDLILNKLPLHKVPDLVTCEISHKLVKALISFDQDFITIYNPFTDGYYHYDLDEFSVFKGPITNFILSKIKEPGNANIRFKKRFFRWYRFFCDNENNLESNLEKDELKTEKE